MRLFLVYFLWSAVYSHSQSLFGYEKASMLTYVLGTSVLQALILSSRSIDVAGEISNGDLSNYLLKPINYFRYWLARDLADKLLNSLFVVAEMALIIWWLRPPLVLPENVGTIFLACLAAGFGLLLYFYLSLLISLTTFWYVEHSGWPARFLFQVLLEFVAGGLFPLNILPVGLFAVIRWLPTSFLLFFPLQIWLGQVGGRTLGLGLVLMLFWIWFLRFLVKWVWRQGLRVYEAYGR